MRWCDTHTHTHMRRLLRISIEFNLFAPCLITGYVDDSIYSHELYSTCRWISHSCICTSARILTLITIFVFVKYLLFYKILLWGCEIYKSVDQTQFICSDCFAFFCSESSFRSKIIVSVLRITTTTRSQTTNNKTTANINIYNCSPFSICSCLVHIYGNLTWATLTEHRQISDFVSLSQLDDFGHTLLNGIFIFSLSLTVHYFYFGGNVVKFKVKFELK